MCEMWLFDLFFLNFANMICLGTDILKYFRESTGLWDNESWLYGTNSADDKLISILPENTHVFSIFLVFKALI